MIRHTVLFKFNPDFPPADKQVWIAGLHKMSGNIPGMISLTRGPDVHPPAARAVQGIFIP